MPAEIIVVFVSLLAVIDPFASMPVFMAFFGRKSKKERRKAAFEACIAAFFVLIVFVVFGSLILELLSVSLTAFMIAGGILLLLLSFDFLRGELPASRHAEQENAVVPIGTPLLAGPGAISTSIYFSGTYGAPEAIAAITAVMAIAFVLLYKSTGIGRVIGKNGIRIMTRIMGLLTAVVAVSLIEKALVTYGLIAI